MKLFLFTMISALIITGSIYAEKMLTDIGYDIAGGLIRTVVTMLMGGLIFTCCDRIER